MPKHEANSRVEHLQKIWLKTACGLLAVVLAISHAYGGGSGWPDAQTYDAMLAGRGLETFELAMGNHSSFGSVVRVRGNLSGTYEVRGRRWRTLPTPEPKHCGVFEMAVDRSHVLGLIRTLRKHRFGELRSSKPKHPERRPSMSIYVHYGGRERIVVIHDEKSPETREIHEQFAVLWGALKTPLLSCRLTPVYALSLRVTVPRPLESREPFQGKLEFENTGPNPVQISDPAEPSVASRGWFRTRFLVQISRKQLPDEQGWKLFTVKRRAGTHPNVTIAAGEKFAVESTWKVPDLERGNYRMWVGAHFLCFRGSEGDRPEPLFEPNGYAELVSIPCEIEIK